MSLRRQGFDVSLHQGAIDWAQVVDAAFDFVFIRALLGTTLDSRLVENLAGALSAGLETSVYHVVHEDVSAERQAATLLETLAALKLCSRLPVALDIERPLAAGSTNAHRRTLEHARIVAAFLQDAGYRVMIYTGAWWWNPATAGVDVSWATALDLWVATYGTQAPILPNGWSDWRFWQYTNSGRVAGISKNVDLNTFSGDWAAYRGVASIPTIYLRGKMLDLVLDGQVVARIAAEEESAPEEPPTTEAQWMLPVGTSLYPAQSWGVRGYTHDLRTTEENPNRLNGKPHPHSGYDINLDVPPYGDVERGLPVYAVASGVVHYVTDSWSGVGMCVVQHEHEGALVWFRYAHLTVAVQAGEAVEAGQVLGVIADYPNEGDHLHLDAALDPFTREWIVDTIRWIDPAPILRGHIDPALVNGMLRVGD